MSLREKERPPTVDELKHERLSFTVSSVFRELDTEGKGSVSRDKFDKAIFIVHRDLELKHKIDSGLPWRFLKNEPRTAFELLSKRVPDDLFVTRDRVILKPLGKSSTIILPHSERETIEVAIRRWKRTGFVTSKRTIDRYLPQEALFLREFESFESMIREISSQMQISESQIGEVQSRLGRIEGLLPDEGFEGLHPLILRTEEVLDILAEDDVRHLIGSRGTIEKLRKLLAQYASFSISDNLPEEWVSGKLRIWLRHVTEYEVDLARMERHVYTRVYKRKGTSHPLSAKLHEVSWNMYEESQ